MSFRHVAVLTLGGWYLMLPPVGSVESKRNSSSGFYVGYSRRRLSAWDIAGSYGTAAECNAALDQGNQRARQGCPDCSSVAACIASDDPHLKSKESLW